MYNNDTGSAKTERLLADILREIRKSQPHRSQFRQALVWILVAFATPVVGAIAVPGAHQAFARAACYVKYLIPPYEAHPAGFQNGA
jgi:hypothetical protein